MLLDKYLTHMSMSSCQLSLHLSLLLIDFDAKMLKFKFAGLGCAAGPQGVQTIFLLIINESNQISEILDCQKLQQNYQQTCQASFC